MFLSFNIAIFVIKFAQILKVFHAKEDTMKVKRLLAYILSVCLVSGSLGQGVFAHEGSVETPVESSVEKDEAENVQKEDATEAEEIKNEKESEEKQEESPAENQVMKQGEETNGTTVAPLGLTDGYRGELQASDFSKWESLNNQTFTDSTILSLSQEKVLSYKKNAFRDIRVFNTDSTPQTDGSIEIVFKLSAQTLDENGRFGIIYRATQENYAMVNFGRNQNGQGEWVLESKSDWKDLEGPEMELGEWNKLALFYQGTAVKVFLNDRQIFDLDSQTLNGPAGYPMEAGKVGFRDYWYPKTVEIKSYKAGAYEDIKTLNMESFDAKFIQAKAAVDSPRYLQDSKAGLITLLSTLPRFFESKQEVDEAISRIEEEMSKLQEKAQAEKEILQNQFMEVEVNKAFPQVFSYKMKEHSNAILYGQRQALDTIVINGEIVKPKVTSQKVDDTKIEYTLLCESDPIHCELKAEIRLEDGNLVWAITEVKNLNQDPDTDEKLVRTIDVPNLSIVSINSNETEPVLHGGKVHVSTVNIQQISGVQSGDKEVSLTANTNFSSEGFYIATIYNNRLAASIYTNSDHSGRYGDWNFTRAFLQREEDGSKSIGLSSIPWVYQRGMEYRVQNEEINGQTELPLIRVRIVGDANEDGKVNWNDGAIAYRHIQPYRKGSEMVPDTVAMRIAMNFGSHAQNPFLTTLDNVKKVYLHTDGLGQNVLLKGYGSEGHDSGHLNYADIGRRIGGAEDMKTLMAEGHKYGARFGIHVNASETYPESKYFQPERLRGTPKNYNYGWNWIDQGINIDADYDLKNGREQRFIDLAKALDKGDGTNDLDYIYVDVWGNGQSGDNSSWPSMQLAKEIQRRGWAVAGEWGYAFAPVSIFQHWAADVTYGGYRLKGINSKLIRFVENGQRDSWTSNYYNYSGTAINPLLGGYNMKDFEGWQGRNGYAAYIQNLFHRDVPSKFVQHFDVVEWVDGTPVRLPRVDNNQAALWIPEMKVVLENASLNKKVEITRGSNEFTTANQVGYRSRTMRMDGKVVLEETVTPSMQRDETEVKYLLPWYWDGNGKRLSAEQEKLYAFSSKTETNHWELPEGWSDAQKLYVYELTDLGRTNEREIPVNGGAINLEVMEGTPYVLYKSSNPENRQVEWSEHSFVKDTGFNSRSLSHWEIKGGVEGSDATRDLAVVDTDSGTQVLKIRNNSEDVTLTQPIKGLKPNTKYALYIGVENRSDEEASMEVLNGDTVLAKNQTKHSIAFNFIQAYTHNTNSQSATVNERNPWGRMGTSYFQNMYVFFTTPANTDNLFLRIGKKAGEGTTYFDDIRFVENNGNPYQATAEGMLFKQDFENVAQGVYPFVLSGVEFVQDNRQHLSERHEPYTQRGWDTKLVSDVIEGTWSLKVNGLINRRNLLFQTIPQNYSFKAGKSYRVRFDYLAGTDGAFDFVLGKGNYYGNSADKIIFTESLKGTRYNEGVEHNQYEFEFIVPEGAEDYWIGIYSNATQEDARGVEQKDLNFSGVKDFVLDNLEILEKENGTRNTEVLREIIEKAQALLNDPKAEQKYTAQTLTRLQSVVELALRRIEDERIGQKSLDDMVVRLRNAMNELELYLPDTLELQHYLRNAKRVLEDTTYGDTHKPELRTAVEEVEAFLAQEYLPANEIHKNQEKLRNALNKVRMSKNEVTESIVMQKIPAENITAVSASSEAPYDGYATKDKAVDGKYNNFWHNDWNAGTTVPHWLILKFNEPKKLTSMNYYARYNVSDGAGRIRTYKVESSSDGVVWSDIPTPGSFPFQPRQIEYNPIPFGAPVTAQYIRFTILTSNGNLGVLTELEFFEEGKSTEEVVPLPKSVNAENLKEEIKRSNEERIADAYEFNEEKRKQEFENALSEAKKLLSKLAENSTTQEMVDKAEQELKAAREKLTGKQAIAELEKTFEDKLQKAFAAKPYTMQTYNELKEILNKLPKYSKWWMFGPEKLEQYRKAITSGEVLLPYVPEVTTPDTEEKIEDNRLPLSPLKPSEKMSFDDAKPSDWYYESVSMLYDAGLMKGISEKTFGPELEVSRAMLPTVLYRISKETLTQMTSKSFTDVEATEWYHDALQWAKEKGYVKGFEDGSFGPNEKVTRQDFLTTLYRFGKDKVKQDGKESVSFTDSEKIADYAKESVDWAVKHGIVKGRPDGKLDPKAWITRAEMAEILVRFIKLTEK